MAIWGSKQTIEKAERELRWLEGRRPARELRVLEATPQKAHRISAEGRARIAAAQRKRWADAKAAGSTHLRRPRSKAAAD